jgi:uncharacterized protein
MQVRKVDIDFSDAKIHWNPTWPEYSQFLNGMATGFPYLEPYLIKVIRQAAKFAPPEMQKDVELLCGQEGQHYKQHAKFNKKLFTEGGYDTSDIEEKLQQSYEKCLKTKSLKFNLGYCDGFETFGPMLTYFFFDHAPDLMKDWDEPTVWLWLWHLSEEYEHRSVTYELYKALYGDYRSYLYRLYMMCYAMIQLFGYGLKGYARIIRKDRATMSLRENVQSRIRFAKVFCRLSSFIGSHMVTKCMRRDYDPGKLSMPENVQFFLDDASQRYGLLQSA